MPGDKSKLKSKTETVRSSQPDLSGITHVAIIMDGNRRWADKRKLPRLLGHKEGVQSLKRLVKHAHTLGLKYLTVYAFSSENWQRGKDEVDYLMELFSQVLRGELSELAANDVRLRFIGDLDGMPPELSKELTKAMEKTRDNQGLNLQIALNYGSRTELTNAVRQIAAEIEGGKLKADQVSEAVIQDRLYTAGMPDPDLLIRTGGEMRLSNYLLWQSAYAELYVTAILWPDFAAADFDKALDDYAGRQRRYGGD